MNLRPEDSSRMLGRSGHLRAKAQSGIQQQIDRMSMDTTSVLPRDPKLMRLFRQNSVEKILQAKPDVSNKTNRDMEAVNREL